MGANNSNPGELHAESRLAASKFAEDEIHVLRKTWQDLADRSNGKGIDKETFLQYFPLHGLLGERLFVQFDVKNTGYIDLDEFITGLAACCRGSAEEKMRFIFNMYDISHENTVSRLDLSTLLNHVPKYVLHTNNNSFHNTSWRHGGNLSSGGVGQIGSDVGSEDGISSDSSHNEYTASHNNTIASSTPGIIDDDDNVNQYTNYDAVEKAFEECDLHHEGRLNFEEFKMWLQRTPEVMEYLESILPYVGTKESHSHHDKIETLPMSSGMRRSRSSLTPNYRNSSFSLSAVAEHIRKPSSANLASAPSPKPGGSNNELNNSGHGVLPANSSWALGQSFHGGLSHGRAPSGSSADQSPMPHYPFYYGGHHSPEPGAESSDMQADQNAIQLLKQAYDSAQSDNLRRKIDDLLRAIGQQVPEADKTTIVMKEGYLWKKGGKFHLWSRRWYLVSGNCMYYYTHQTDTIPKGVIFLTGCLIEKSVDEENEVKGYYGFEVIHRDLCSGGAGEDVTHHRHEVRTLFTRTPADRDAWVSLLQRAAQVVPIEDDYVIGKELGRGRFSRVCECINKVTTEHFAVKIIDKTTIAAEDKSLIRTEIAVMKLVNHPNIIRLEGLYESRTCLYIVMEMLKGGELFDRIVGKPRFSEADAAKLIRPLLESVAYLHDLGIVHRDLKPENILCGENLEDLKIADFGLSKMLLPKEKMDTACGTLSYVAPEVLTMQGYDKAADMWSVGVIMFLLVCGKLPFDGDDHEEIIRNTIQAEVRVSPGVWNKLSEDAKSLLVAMLNKDPRHRITAREALKHPYILTHCPHRRAHSMSATIPPLLRPSSSVDGLKKISSIGSTDGSENVPVRQTVKSEVATV